MGDQAARTTPGRFGTIAVVPPRYGEGVVGGAEAVLAETAHGLAARGWSVEVLTTCAIDHYTWANYFPAGTETDGDVTVRRFPTVTDTPGKHRDRIGQRILSGEVVSITDQQRWLNDSLRVPELWHWMLQHHHDYRAVIAGPYMFWTTAAVGLLAADRLILMPCFHDEPPGRLSVFNPLFGGARGIWFLSQPEADLAAAVQPLPSRSAVLGAGLSEPNHHDPEAFRAAFGVEGPFVYYAGRREWGKGWDDLLSAFRAVRPGRLQLVTSGVGEVVGERGVIDVGFLSDQQRTNAMAAASAYVQPSGLESFSRTVLEAMLAETPVIANGASEVVAWHLERSGCGLSYRGVDELTRALDLVVDEPESLAAIGRGGADYVRQHYRPAHVLDGVEAMLEDWTRAPSP